MWRVEIENERGDGVDSILLIHTIDYLNSLRQIHGDRMKILETFPINGRREMELEQSLRDIKAIIDGVL